MKLRLFTGMLLVVFLSVFNSTQASAHDGCKDNCCSRYYHHHGCWGHHGYIYGPDGYFAQHKAACCDKKSDAKCSSSSSCGHSCAYSCHYTYRRAYYHEDCCGHGHLHTACSKDKDKDNDNDD